VCEEVDHGTQNNADRDSAVVFSDVPTNGEKPAIHGVIGYDSLAMDCDSLAMGCDSLAIGISRIVIVVII